MKPVVGFALAAFATLLPVQAGPGRMDVSKRAAQMSTDEKAVLPENQPIKRDDIIMNKRFQTGTYEKKDALVGERRSSISVEESHEKKLFPTPDRKEYNMIERKDSSWSGKQSRFSTSADSYRSKVAVRFQDKIGETLPFAGDVKPVVAKRTTFDRINRFAFRRNGGDGVKVTTAGSDTASRDISGSSSVSPGGSGDKNTPPVDGPVTPGTR